MCRIGIILASTRPNRNGEQVARWVFDIAAERADAEFELVDFRDYPSCSSPPSTTNHGTSGVLKNAIDYLYAEVIGWSTALAPLRQPAIATWKPLPDLVDDACALGHAMRLHCVEVSSLAATPRGPSDSGSLSDVGTGRRPPDVKVLFIDERVEGFFLERFNDRGELVGTTQHETMDEAMWQASSEYELADWRSCPEDVDPVAYIRAHADSDSGVANRDR
jgi:NADPH-dependent FMN reductase